MKCPNCNQTDEWAWTPATNEDGWKCYCGYKPGEPEGYFPQLDRAFLEEKVSSLLFWLTDGTEIPFISLSNSSEGDYLMSAIVKECKKQGLYDQYTILRIILETVTPRHADYWKKIGEGIVSGNDKRARCHCGQLAVCYKAEGHFCAQHGREELLPFE